MAKKRVIIACGNGVATSTVVASKVKAPCIMAISLLTGINEEPTLQKIVAALQD